MKELLESFIHEDYKEDGIKQYRLVGVDTSKVDVWEFMDEFEQEDGIQVIIFRGKASSYEEEISLSKEIRIIRNRAHSRNNIAMVFTNMSQSYWRNRVDCDLVISKNDSGEYIAVKNRAGRTAKVHVDF